VPETNVEAQKIAELEVKNTELNDKFLRLAAELDNVRRRSREELEKSSKFAISNFVGDLVVVRIKSQIRAAVKREGREKTRNP
jgi:molecular chaperone GrpE